MARSKGTSLLKATDQFRRLEQKVARCERALEKAHKKCAEAEEEYLRLAAEAFTSRHRPLPGGEEGSPASAP